MLSSVSDKQIDGVKNKEILHDKKNTMSIKTPAEQFNIIDIIIPLLFAMKLYWHQDAAQDAGAEGKHTLSHFTAQNRDNKRVYVEIKQGTFPWAFFSCPVGVDTFSGQEIFQWKKIQADSFSEIIYFNSKETWC